ncbi:MAG TPA: DsbC family protein [Gammaproteobacteria bacterium]
MNKSWILIPLVLVLPGVLAQEALQPTREDIAARLNGVVAEDLKDSALDGFYEVNVGSRVAYISVDGRFLFEGELYDLQQSQNLTEVSRSRARVDLLEDVDRETMIVFSPEEGPVEHTITIFTDIDCGYCRQFHREIEQVTALGIEVQYLFFPRTGPDTDSWFKAERVWCAEDRNSALTSAKLGGHVPEVTCVANPVAAHYDIGNQVGVTGTPSIYTSGGRHIGGYLPPQQLLATLTQLVQ